MKHQQSTRNRVTGLVLLLLLLAPVGLAPAGEQVSGLRARHRAGQTFLTWQEIEPPVTKDAIEARELKRILRDIEKTGRWKL